MRCVRGALPVFVDIQPDTLNIDPHRVAAAWIGPDQGAPGRAPAGNAVQPGRAGGAGGLTRRGGRGRGVRDRQRGALAGRMAANRPAARRRGLFLVPPAQAALHRRRRHVDDSPCGPRRTLPAAPAARREGVPDTVRHASRDVVFESYPVFGFNYRMTDIQAAIGREHSAGWGRWSRGGASWRHAMRTGCRASRAWSSPVSPPGRGRTGGYAVRLERPTYAR